MAVGDDDDDADGARESAGGLGEWVLPLVFAGHVARVKEKQQTSGRQAGRQTAGQTGERAGLTVRRGLAMAGGVGAAALGPAVVRRRALLLGGAREGGGAAAVIREPAPASLAVVGLGLGAAAEAGSTAEGGGVGAWGGGVCSVSSEAPYYVDERLHCPVSHMAEDGTRQQCRLHVLCLTPQQEGEGGAEQQQQGAEAAACGEGGGGWVLDICLDYFSTHNPFLRQLMRLPVAPDTTTSPSPASAEPGQLQSGAVAVRRFFEAPLFRRQGLGHVQDRIRQASQPASTTMAMHPT